ncbi:MAG TPA: response regulator [Bryobacteraceae bacterium]|jgi:two-component system chemotaxis response regulator CheY|nr:response regulator [Bryobacteraceae bacterium]
MAFRVLIVDDSAAMRCFVRRVIELSGFEADVFLEAGDGKEALALLNANWVDVVLTDINMPNMNGEELLSSMAADETLRTIPVIVVSTDGTDLRRSRMLELGARGYVRKPFTPEELRAKLEALLGVPHIA